MLSQEGSVPWKRCPRLEMVKIKAVESSCDVIWPKRDFHTVWYCNLLRYVGGTRFPGIHKEI